jgi:hypothetical protein
MRISYHALGKPEMPGWVEIRGVGRILVDDENLDEAREFDGQVAWDMERMSPSDFTAYEFLGIEHYTLGDAIPLRELPHEDPLPDALARKFFYPHRDADFAPWLREFLRELPTADRILNLPEGQVTAIEDASAEYLVAVDSGEDLATKKNAAVRALREILDTMAHHPEFGDALAASLGLTGKKQSVG